MSHDDAAPPSTFRLISEARVGFEWIAGLAARSAIVHGHDGQGRRVLVIPGFLADDHFTHPLRSMLAQAGYRPEGWTLGRNSRIAPKLFADLLARIDTLAAEAPIALIGWSLGGLYAREAAKRRPALVERVLTLGSPFSGDRHANNAWRLYERVSGHSVDYPPVEVNLGEKPPVRTIALWSPHDGVVAPASARGRPGEADEAIEVDCSHMGFICAPAALRAILKALA